MMSYSLERRDKMIDEILMAAVWKSGNHISEEELDRYEAWLLMQKDFILTNKIVF